MHTDDEAECQNKELEIKLQNILLIYAGHETSCCDSIVL